MNNKETHFPTRQVAIGEANHFFGYYNKSNFDSNGQRILANRVSMLTGNLTGKEIAKVGFFDLTDNDKFYELAETTCWNWQMGCQLQWVGNQNKIIFNSRNQNSEWTNTPFDDFRSRIIDLDTGEQRELPLPIYVMAPNGDYALTVNYSRFMITHQTIGYHATTAEPKIENAPKNDGIFRLNIATGDYELILSLNKLSNFKPLPSMEKAIHWVTHMEANPSGTRFLFIHRWTERVLDETCFLHRLFTVNADGTELRLLECSDHPLPQLEDGFDINKVGTFDYEKSEFQISHPIWKSDEEIIVWGPHQGQIHYHLYNDITGEVEVIGRGILNENGHMSYSKDGRWILSDTYPDVETDERILFLFNVSTGERHDLGSFYTSPDLGKHNRCDLHPRWSSDNQSVCIDSVHEGSRQLYIIDVSSLINHDAGKQYKITPYLNV